jgi:sterol desaturase/sphingolipid hydroxylase (fatty acid hydroxylase superfamily)
MCCAACQRAEATHLASTPHTITAINLAVTGVALYTLHNSDSFNNILSQTYARYHWLISHRMFEACVAVLSFTVWGFLFAFFAPFVPKLRTIMISKDKATALNSSSKVITAVTKTRQKIFFEVGSESSTSGSRDATILPTSDNFFFWVLVNISVYLGAIDVFQRFMGAFFTPRQHVDTEAPTVLRVVVEVLFSVWAYDFLFYWIHCSWHNAFHNNWSIPWWRKLHLTHHNNFQHSKQALRPMSTFHHHFLDAAAQVCINIIVQQIPLSFVFSGPRHKLSKAIHNILVTYLLVEAHSGFDLPFMSHRLFPSVFGGSILHQIHHQYGTVFFHQFFKYLDA